MIKLCAVIPELFLLNVQNLIQKEFTDFSVEYLLYKDFKQAAALISDRQTIYDAILFGGPSTYHSAHALIQPKTHWTYIPRANESLLMALAKAVRRGWDIKHLSIDTFNTSAILETLSELEISIKPEEIHTLTGDICNAAFVERAIKFHHTNLLGANTTKSLTSISSVATAFKINNIDFIPIIPTINVMRDTLKSIRKFYEYGELSKNASAVIIIKIRPSTPLSETNMPAYNFMLERLTAAKEIFCFAKQLKAALVEESNTTYFLFSSANTLKITTKHFENYDFLDTLKKHTLCQFSIGIGLGKTFEESQRFAYNALQNALVKQESYVSIIDTDGKAKDTQFSNKHPVTPSIPENKLMAVANSLGISINTIIKVYAFMEEHKRLYYTSQEIANGLKISKRNADRLLEKFIDNGYATIEGRKIINVSGRPCRLIKLKLFH